jgi:hypothetical protein
MSEGAIGLSVLLSISVLSALVFHWRIAHFKLASFGAAFFSAVAFQIAAYLRVGHFDPFTIVGCVVGGVVALVIAALVGLPFALARRNAKSSDAS